MMASSLKDIAGMTGYSVSTVSRALSNAVNVRPAVRRKIAAAARELGYRTSSSRIFLICESLAPSIYYDHAVAPLAQILRSAGYTLELTDRQGVELIEERSVAGVISMMVFDGLERCWGKQYTIPLVCINTSAAHFDGICSVMNDDGDGIRRMTEYLIGLGHRKIGIFGWFLWPGSCSGANQYYETRLNVFQQVMRAHGLRDDFIAARSEGDELAALIKPLLDQGVTAFIGNGEDAGLELLYALRVLGRRVPEEVSVMSWMSPQFRCFAWPVLSGVMQNFSEIAANAAKLLLDQIAGVREVRDVIVPPHWISGNSAAAPGKKTDAVS